MIKIMVGFERPAYKYHLYSQALIMAITQSNKIERFLVIMQMQLVYSVRNGMIGYENLIIHLFSLSKDADFAWSVVINNWGV